MMKLFISSVLGFLLAMTACGTVAVTPTQQVSVQPTPNAVTPTVPAPTRAPGGTPAGVSVASPVNGARVSSPIRVAGAGHAFEGQIEVRVKDNNGQVIGSEHAMGGSVGTPVPFAIDVPFQAPRAESPGTIEVYTVSPKDGSIQDLTTIQVILEPANQ